MKWNLLYLLAGLLLLTAGAAFLFITKQGNSTFAVLFITLGCSSLLLYFLSFRKNKNSRNN